MTSQHETMMTLSKVLQIGQFTSAQQTLIDAEVHRFVEADLLNDAAVFEKIEAILTRSSSQVPASLLDRLPNLKIIATSGVGFDGIPVDVAHGKGVTVTNTPGVLDAAVCELAIGLLLSLLRRIPSADQFVRDGAWGRDSFPLTSSLAGKKIGIVGLGRIGRGIASRLTGFEVEIAYCGSLVEDVAYRRINEIRALADFADILIVCCPGGERTRHLVDAAILSALGSQGFLINVSRGSVVDEVALIRALENGVIGGAALDVFEKEPLTESKLSKFSNVIFTPHVGSATNETRNAMLRLALDNIHSVLEGNHALTPVI